MLHSLAHAALEVVDTPQQHHGNLHSCPHGTVVYWQSSADRRRRWRKVHPSDPVPRLVGSYTGESDVYATVNEFHGWRQVRLLKSLRACFVDVDNNEDLYEVLDALHDQRLPEPNLVVYSGRGMHLYWLIEPVPPKALRYWAAIQDRLVKALQPLGSDPKARDAARILRVPGTRHSVAAKEVEGVILHDWKWHIDTLGCEVLPYSRDEVRDFRAAQAKKRGHKAKRTRRSQRTIFDWWHGVYIDLLKIGEHHWFGGVPEGNRDNFLFLTSVALSWFTHGDALRNEIVSTARTWTPTLTKNEVLRQMQTVIRRAEREAAARTRGEHVPRTQGRYWMRRKTIREWLGDAITPEIEPQLTALASDEVLAERRRKKDAARWSDHYTRKGYRSSNERKRAQARLMAAQGHSQRAIARELGVHMRTVQRWLQG